MNSIIFLFCSSASLSSAPVFTLLNISRAALVAGLSCLFYSLIVIDLKVLAFSLTEVIYFFKVDAILFYTLFFSCSLFDYNESDELSSTFAYFFKLDYEFLLFCLKTISPKDLLNFSLISSFLELLL